jgi:hypothetical protein
MSKTIPRTSAQLPDLPEFDGFSNDLLAEIKIRARLRLNALHADDPAVLRYARSISRRRRWPLPSTVDQWKLQHALNLVATEAGFHDWHAARTVLSGKLKPGGDFGGFWHSRNCEGLLNHWFADYTDAKAHQSHHAVSWLFPFQKQFVVGDAYYVRALLLDPDSELWQRAQFDLVGSYGSEAWHRLSAARLNATRNLPPPIAR